MFAAFLFWTVPVWGQVGVPSSPARIQLTPIGSYETGLFDEGAAEIAAYDDRTQRLFVVNAGAAGIDVLDISDPTNPSKLFTIDVTPYGDQANSVDVRNGLVVAAVEADDTQAPGQAVFFEADGAFVGQAIVGALPDMITFTPNGRYVLVANEGEPNDDYTVDPEGSISIIAMQGRKVGAVRTAGFTAFNDAALDPSIRIFGPGATVAQDLEPEYIAVTTNSKTAYVTLQENNALAVVDIENAVVTDLIGLGFKDHSLPGNGLDASNEDGGINITTWPVKGMYQPDAIEAFRAPGGTYLITANEGDARDYDGFSEEERIGDLVLDPTAFPSAATLQAEENLGRLNTTTAIGDTDGDGDFDELFAYGARSFSIWSEDGTLVYDSGDLLEQLTAEQFPDQFNSNNDENGSFDARSDDKGPEPEGVTVGRVQGHPYAFVGLERIGGIMVFDVTNPENPAFVEYVTTRDFSGDAEAGTAGDLAPEGLLFIEPGKSPNHKPLLVVSYEVSGSIGIFQIDTVRHNVVSVIEQFLADKTGAPPDHFALAANYPNPFNPETTIQFHVPEAQYVRLTIYDVQGRSVITLADAPFEAGTYEVRWDGTNRQGRAVASGTYLYRLEAGAFSRTRAMHLVK